MDVEYGIVASGSCLISDIARKLNEDIKLKNTIERICDNLNKFDKKELIIRNYLATIGNIFGEEPVAIFDDSDITKEEKQPISVYSEIYSCKSKNFKSQIIIH